MTLRVATANLFKGMPLEKVRAGVDTLYTHGPDVAALQEWVRGRDSVLRDLRRRGLSFCRPSEGGGPIVYTSRFSPARCRGVTLARRELVGHLPGRKDRLPASIANLTILVDDATDDELAVVNFHLTAEVQYAGRYRRDPAHLLRVRRHKREVRRLTRLARRQRHKGRRVFLCGDTNYDGLRIKGLVSCWEGHAGHTLGPRAVDTVFAETPAHSVKTVVTGSDHRAVVVTYKES